MSENENKKPQHIVENFIKLVGAAEANYKKAKKELEASIRNEVNNALSAYFDEYGDVVHSVGWAQYTPYFNDGDPCIFRTYDPGIRFVRLMEDGTYERNEEYDDHTWSEEAVSLLYQKVYEYYVEDGEESVEVSWRPGEFKTQTKWKEIEVPLTEREIDAAQTMTQFLRAIPESMKETVWGEGLVVIDSSGVRVEDYNHD